MSWEDDDFGAEFIKFKESNPTNSSNWSPNNTLLVIQADYNSILDYTNQWNKKRKKIRVQEVVMAAGTPYTSDFIREHDDLWLDMGARLFKVVKQAYLKKWKYIRIDKTSNPMDKFDTWYTVKEYKLSIQKTITDKTPAKKTVKKTK